jgi:hypothetical protein
MYEIDEFNGTDRRKRSHKWGYYDRRKRERVTKHQKCDPNPKEEIAVNIALIVSISIFFVAVLLRFFDV